MKCIMEQFSWAEKRNIQNKRAFPYYKQRLKIDTHIQTSPKTFLITKAENSYSHLVSPPNKVYKANNKTNTK